MNGKIPRPTSIPRKAIPIPTTTLISGIRKSPRAPKLDAAKPNLIRQQTIIQRPKINLVPNHNLARRSKSFSDIRLIQKQNVVNFRKPAIPAKRPAPSLTPSAGPPSAKQPKVKIPPYDYKARYNDLLEKHTTLKEKCSVFNERCKNLEIENKDCARYKNLLQDTLSQLEELKQIHNEDRHKYSIINKNYEECKTKNSLISTRLTETELLLKECQEQNQRKSSQLSTMTSDNEGLKETIKILEGKMRILEKQSNFYKESLMSSHAQRKQMHNTILDLKGNIRVFCRVRPPLKTECDEELCVWNYPDECSVDVVKMNCPQSGNNKISKHEFSFDKVFTQNASQEEVFHEVDSLIQSALDGYNVCIFAYGQTGSGKTYTMEGTINNSGLIPRSVDFLFQHMQSMEPLGWSYTIRASFLEIYNEQIRDLLNSENSEVNHEIKLVDSKQKDVYVTNIEEKEVKNAKELKKLLHLAQTYRITAATDSNERSSRSHSIAKIIISCTNPHGETMKGTLNLVDLAGSESPKTSIRMSETKSINKSLAQLGKVILSLQQKQEHIPYRSSKLTFLLMPCLGGSSKTLMFVNINPLVANHSESINSLRFASQVNQVKTQRAKKNILRPKSNLS